MFRSLDNPVTCRFDQLTFVDHIKEIYIIIISHNINI